MVYQKRGSKVRALFDQNNLLRKEQPIQNTIKQAWFWLRRCAALVASENHSKMRHRHQMFPNIACIFSFHHQPQVERKLMTKEIKIHPSARSVPLLCSQNFAIKDALGLQICHINYKMRGGKLRCFPKINNHFRTTGNKLLSPARLLACSPA